MSYYSTIINVFRVENIDGIGPYRPESPIRAFLSSMHSDSESHPTVYNDGICKLFELGHYEFCGFSSYESLLLWFNDTIELLKVHSFLLAIYEVDRMHVKYGSKQLVFDKRYAKRIYTSYDFKLDSYKGHANVSSVTLC